MGLWRPSEPVQPSPVMAGLLVFRVAIVVSLLVSKAATEPAKRVTGIGQVKLHRACCVYQDSTVFLELLLGLLQSFGYLLEFLES